VAIYQWRNAQYQTDVANSSRLALLARSRAEGDLDLALLLNLEAFKTAPTFEALSGLLTLAGRSPHPGRFLHGHTGVVQAVAFAPDGRFAVSGGRDGKVIVWDLETGARTPLVEGGSGSRIVAFSPDGRLLAATVSCDGTLSLWNTKTWKLVRKLSGGQNDVRSLAFSLDGQRLAAGAYDRSIVVWNDLPGIAQRNVQSTVEPLTLTRTPSEVVSVAFSPRGTFLASGHRNGSVLLWDTKLMKSRELRKHREVVTSLAFSPDGRLLISASDDRTMLVWDALDVKATAPLHSIGGQRSVKSVAISRDGRLLASGSDDRTIRLWDISQTESTEMQIDERLPLVGHGSFIESVAFSADGTQLVSGDWDGRLILWDLGKESLVDAVIEDPHNGPIGVLAWSPDGKSLAWTDADGHVVRRNLVTQKYELDKRTVPKGRGVTLTIDPNGQLVWSGVDGREFSRQDVETGQSLDSVQLSGAVAPGVAVSPDGRLLAYGTQTTQADDRLLHEILVWDLDAGRQAHRFENGDVQVESLAFSPDVRVLASGRGAGLVVLWDLTAEKELGRLVGHEGTVRSLAFSPDGKWLAAGSWDRRIFIWDLSMRQLLGVLSTGHARAVSGLTFSPDGKRLASGGDSDGKIRLWNIGIDALLKHAGHTANRPLLREELLVILGPDIRYRVE
jgi:WD40 repeat protein